eukprot:scaffold1282_cov251-Pinguiococcus_pyrenoidosus.AAC.46
MPKDSDWLALAQIPEDCRPIKTRTCQDGRAVNRLKSRHRVLMPPRPRIPDSYGAVPSSTACNVGGACRRLRRRALVDLHAVQPSDGSHCPRVALQDQVVPFATVLPSHLICCVVVGELEHLDAFIVAARRQQRKPWVPADVVDGPAVQILPFTDDRAMQASQGNVLIRPAHTRAFPGKLQAISFPPRSLRDVTDSQMLRARADCEIASARRHLHASDGLHTVLAEDVGGANAHLINALAFKALHRGPRCRTLRRMELLRLSHAVPRGLLQVPLVFPMPRACERDPPSAPRLRTTPYRLREVSLTSSEGLPAGCWPAAARIAESLQDSHHGSPGSRVPAHPLGMRSWIASPWQAMGCSQPVLSAPRSPDSTPAAVYHPATSLCYVFPHQRSRSLATRSPPGRSLRPDQTRSTAKQTAPSPVPAPAACRGTACANAGARRPLHRGAGDRRSRHRSRPCRPAAEVPGCGRAWARPRETARGDPARDSSPGAPRGSSSGAT